MESPLVLLPSNSIMLKNGNLSDYEPSVLTKTTNSPVSFETFAEKEESDEEEENCSSSSWKLSPFSRQRQALPLNQNSDAVLNIRPSHYEEFRCPICLDLLNKTSAAMDCLHRFCFECISSALRAGNKECPTCRIKIVSKRSLRQDPAFDDLINLLFPDRDVVNNYYQLALLKRDLLTQNTTEDPCKPLHADLKTAGNFVDVVTEPVKHIGAQLEVSMRKQAEMVKALSAKRRKLQNIKQQQQQGELHVSRSFESNASTYTDDMETQDTFSAAGEKVKRSTASLESIEDEPPLVDDDLDEQTSTQSEQQADRLLVVANNHSISDIHSGKLLRVTISPHKQLESKYKIDPRYLLIPLHTNVEAICRYIHYCISLQSAGQTSNQLLHTQATNVHHSRQVLCALADIDLKNFHIHIPSADFRGSIRVNSNMKMKGICDRYKRIHSKLPVYLQLFYMFTTNTT